MDQRTREQRAMSDMLEAAKRQQHEMEALAETRTDWGRATRLVRPAEWDGTITIGAGQVIFAAEPTYTPPMDAPNLRRVIAGAVYDFAASLTTRKEPITLGSSHHAGPAAEACEAFLRSRGCSDGEPMVKDWQEHLGAPVGTAATRMRSELHLMVVTAAVDAGLGHALADKIAKSAVSNALAAKVV